MSYSKTVASYPDWFLPLASEFEAPTLTRRKAYILPDHKAALRLRAQLYGFLYAMRHEGLDKLYPNFQSVRLVIRENELHILHANEYLPRPPEKQNEA
jgi:hypothetical protein